MAPLAAAPAGRRGFTLMEVLAVIFLTALVLGVALNFYVDLSNASTRAAESTRELRRATALLDRVAGDFERALLMRKPAEVDPLTHPWIFVAETWHSELGADRIKFTVRRSVSQASEGPTSDVGMVAYVLRPSEEAEGGFALWRWTAASLPEGLDREFPLDDDPASLLLADGLADFGVRMLGDGGEWVDRWDSSQLVESGELPRAVEIELALLSETAADLGLDAPDDSRTLSRRVMIPMRPVDLEVLLDPEGQELAGEDGAEEDEEDGLTVAQCLDPTLLQGGAEASLGLDQAELDVLALLGPEALDAPFAPYRDQYCGHPAVLAECCQ
jgi:prepilin-type N-terminal cleavage/methylation domain-containing protein